MDQSIGPVDTALSHLRQRLTEVDARIAELRNLMMEREAIQKAITSLEQALSARGTINPVEGNIPIWQGARQILIEHGCEMSVREITDALIARGFSIEGKTPLESVRSILLRKPKVFDRGKNAGFVVHPDITHWRAE